MLTQTPLRAAITAAHHADDAYQAAVEAAGHKSRWDVPANWETLTQEDRDSIREAFNAKVEADVAMHAAFEQSRHETRVVASAQPCQDRESL